MVKITYKKIEDDFYKLRTNGIQAITNTIDKNIVKMVFKNRLESDYIFVDLFINEEPQIYNLELTAFDGVFRNKIVNNYFEGDFFFLPTQDKYKSERITIDNIGDKFIFAYGFFEEV